MSDLNSILLEGNLHNEGKKYTLYTRRVNAGPVTTTVVVEEPDLLEKLTDNIRQGEVWHVRVAGCLDLGMVIKADFIVFKKRLSDVYYDQ